MPHGSSPTTPSTHWHRIYAAFADKLRKNSRMSLKRSKTKSCTSIVNNPAVRTTCWFWRMKIKPTLSLMQKCAKGNYIFRITGGSCAHHLPSNIQQCGQVLKDILIHLSCKTGWSFSILMGGPNPTDPQERCAVTR